MFDTNTIISPNVILWAGYLYLGFLFLGVLKSLLDNQPMWGDFFSDNPEGTHHLSRYVLFFGSLALAARFLVGVLTAHSIEYEGFEKKMTELNSIIQGLNIDGAVGASGIAYLLSKVTNGQILSLFGKRVR